MLNFEYKGISLGKYVEGEIEALNSAEAAHKLKDQKVIITKLKETKKKKTIVATKTTKKKQMKKIEELKTVKEVEISEELYY